MDIEMLRLFVSAAECLNFTKAAEQMYISQPTLSRHISELESMLNVELFERTTRKVKLTQPGEMFLAETKQILGKYDSLMDRVARLGTGVSGHLRIGYLEIFCQDILPPTLREFRRKFPLVDLQLREMSLDGVLTGLQDGSLDVGFVCSHGEPRPDDPMEFRRIMTGEVEMAVGKEHPLSSYHIVSPDVLKDETILIFNKASTPDLREAITRMCLDRGFVPRFSEDSYTPGAIFLLVQAGMGVTLLSSLVTSVLKREQNVHTLKLEGYSIPTYLELAWKKNNQNPCIANFVEETAAIAHPSSAQ